MKIEHLMLFATMFLSGCQSVEVTHVFEGETRRPAVPVETVKVFEKMPAQAVEIAHVKVLSEGADQKSADNAVMAAKKDAALLGANGLCLKNWKTYSGGRIENHWMNFDAFYLP